MSDCSRSFDSAFSAFPDTNLFSEGSISYSFKIRSGSSLDNLKTPGPVEDTDRYFENAENGDQQEPSIDSPTTPLPPRTSHKEAVIPSERDTTSAESDEQAAERDAEESSFFGPQTEMPETPFGKKVFPDHIQTAQDYRKWDEQGREWLYGYVWFCQKKDQSITRGYMQVGCTLTDCSRLDDVR